MFKTTRGSGSWSREEDPIYVLEMGLGRFWHQSIHGNPTKHWRQAVRDVGKIVYG